MCYQNIWGVILVFKMEVMEIFLSGHCSNELVPATGILCSFAVLLCSRQYCGSHTQTVESSLTATRLSPCGLNATMRTVHWSYPPPKNSDVLKLQ